MFYNLLFFFTFPFLSLFFQSSGFLSNILTLSNTLFYGLLSSSRWNIHKKCEAGVKDKTTGKEKGRGLATHRVARQRELACGAVNCALQNGPPACLGAHHAAFMRIHQEPPLPGS
jgi:hypothetical protein